MSSFVAHDLSGFMSVKEATHETDRSVAGATIDEIYRVMTQGGLLILDCGSDLCPPHGEPGYYRGIEKEELEGYLKKYKDIWLEKYGDFLYVRASK